MSYKYIATVFYKINGKEVFEYYEIQHNFDILHASKYELEDKVYNEFHKNHPDINIDDIGIGSINALDGPHKVNRQKEIETINRMNIWKSNNG